MLLWVPPDCNMKLGADQSAYSGQWNCIWNEYQSWQEVVWEWLKAELEIENQEMDCWTTHIEKLTDYTEKYVISKLSYNYFFFQPYHKLAFLSDLPLYTQKEWIDLHGEVLKHKDNFTFIYKGQWLNNLTN